MTIETLTRKGERRYCTQPIVNRVPGAFYASAVDVFERIKREERMKSVTPKYTITIKPAEVNHWDRIAEHCIFYRVERTCVNKAACVAAGRTISDGGIRYIYDTLSERIITYTGGGIVVLSKESYAAVSQFIKENPKGGDITKLVAAGDLV